MKHHTNNLIIGQGLAGTTLAWGLMDAGQSVVLVDRTEAATASRVAAGLVSPWVGRRMTQSDDYEENWNEAVKFYRSIENRLAEPLFTEQSMVRLFLNRSDEAIYQQRKSQTTPGHLEDWSGRLQPHAPAIEGCRMKPAGRLDVRRYLQASIDFFSERGQWYQFDVSLPDGLTVQTDRVLLPDLALSADRVIFCQGAAENPWFEGIPNNVSRGDVINVRLDNYRVSDVVHHSIWLVPEPDGSITAGSTYDWKVIENTPTAAGRREILRAMNRFIEGPIRVKQHTAALRPTMKDYRPVVGRHSSNDRLWIFNGLGSRGVLTAPRMARLLVELITGEREREPDEFGPGRLRQKQEQPSLTEIAHARIAEVLQPGDVAIDATVGNGFDTCFLAQQVGRTGHVFGFDVQELAIESTRKRLESVGLRNVELLQQSHTEISRHVRVSVRAAMFNLGYLPRSDHSIVTRADTTVESLQQILELLADGGMITVLAYRGHNGGTEEAQAVESWQNNQRDCHVQRIDSQPAKTTSPVLFVLTRADADQLGNDIER